MHTSRGKQSKNKINIKSILFWSILTLLTLMYVIISYHVYKTSTVATADEFKDAALNVSIIMFFLLLPYIAFSILFLLFNFGKKFAFEAGGVKFSLEVANDLIDISDSFEDVAKSIRIHEEIINDLVDPDEKLESIHDIELKEFVELMMELYNFKRGDLVQYEVVKINKLDDSRVCFAHNSETVALDLYDVKPEEVQIIKTIIVSTFEIRMREGALCEGK